MDNQRISIASSTLNLYIGNWVDQQFLTYYSNLNIYIFASVECRNSFWKMKINCPPCSLL